MSRIEEQIDKMLQKHRDAVADELTNWKLQAMVHRNARNAIRAEIVAGFTELVEALRRAEQLAEIADDWNLGDDGKVEIDGEWVSCWDLRKEFSAAIAKASRGESDA